MGLSKVCQTFLWHPVLPLNLIVSAVTHIPFQMFTATQVLRARSNIPFVTTPLHAHSAPKDVEDTSPSGGNKQQKKKQSAFTDGLLALHFLCTVSLLLVSPFLQMGKLRFRCFAHVYRTTKWQSQNLNTEQPISKLKLWITI